IHIKCTNISEDTYDVIKNTDGIEWKCDECRNVVDNTCNNSTTATTSSNCECCKIIPDLKRVIDNLNATVLELKKQIASSKTSSDNNIEEIIQEINDRQYRKKNLMIYGVPEQSSQLPAANRQALDKDY